MVLPVRSRSSSPPIKEQLAAPPSIKEPLAAPPQIKEQLTAGSALLVQHTCGCVVQRAAGNAASTQTTPEPYPSRATSSPWARVRGAAARSEWRSRLYGDRPDVPQPVAVATGTRPLGGALTRVSQAHG